MVRERIEAPKTLEPVVMAVVVRGRMWSLMVDKSVGRSRWLDILASS